jgi:PAS domain S-box-containing protein
MRSLPIRIKLILGFAAVGIITFFVGLVGWLGLWHLKGILKEINGVRLPGIVGVVELQGNMWAIQRFERVLLYEKDPEIIQRQFKQLEANWQESRQLIKAYQRLPKTMAERRLWEKLASKWEAWKALHQTVIGLIKKGDLHSLKYAHELSYGQARTVFLENEEIFHQLISLSLKVAAEDHKRAEISEYRARIILDGSTLAGVLGVLFLGLFVTQSIQKGHEALRRSESWFSTTLKSIGDAVIATDPQGRITFMNPVAQIMTGWLIEEALGKPVAEVFQIVNEETGEPVENPVERVIREGMVVGLANHTVLIAQDGTRMPINDSGAPIKDDQGKVIGVVLVFQDITELKEAMDALRRREQETRVTVNNIPGIVFKGYLDGAVELVDPFDDKVEPLTGYSKLDFAYRHLKWTDLIVKEDREGARKSFLQALKADKKAYVREYRIQNREGKEAWIQERSHIICDPRGKVESISGIIFDITERKQIEKVIAEQARILEAFFQYTLTPLAILDKGLNFIRVNQAYVQSGSRKLPDFLSHNHFELYPPEAQEIFAQVLRTKTPFQKHGQPFVDPQHPEWGVDYWDWSLTPLLDPRGAVEFLILSLNDVTENKRGEEALRASEKEYRLLFENAQVGVFRNRIGDGKILKANHRMAEMLGYEDYREFMQVFYSPEHYADAGTRERLIASFQEGRLESHEIRACRKDGSIVWLLISGRLNPEEGYVEGVATDITALKAAEEARREGENFLTNIFASIQDGINILDKNYNIIRVNPAMEKANPHSLPLVGKKCFQAFHGRSQPCEDCATRRTLETKAAAQKLVIERTPGGEILKCCDIQAFPMLDPASGELIGVVEYVRDITEQKQVELALQESREQYRLLVKQIPAVIFKGYADWSVDFFDRKIEALTGYPKADFDSRRVKWCDLILPEDLERTRNILLTAWKTTGSYVCEYRIRKKSGEIAWIQERSQLFSNAAGRISHASGVFFDITERRQVEEALKDSEEKMRLVIESSPIGIGVGQYGRQAYANPALAKMHGYASPMEMVGQPVTHFHAPPYHGLINQTMEALASGQPIIPFYEAQGVKKNGETFDISVWLRRIDYQGEPAILGFAIDVTEQKVLRAQLLQAQKMEAIGTLAGGIAHDFNNILSALVGYTELTLDDTPEGTEAHANLLEVLKAGERARDLVKQILTFSRQDKEQEKKPVQISLIIKEALKFLRASLPTTIDIRQDISCPTGKILADPTQIHQILINLCTNAAQAMQESGGVLTVSLQEVDWGPGDQVPGSDLLPGPYLRLTVSDTGQGMSPKVMARIFEPFFTTKELGGGTGMGLAVVHGIVKSHGGEIKVFSKPGKGSTFQVFFPKIDIQEITETPPLNEIPRGQERILLVDDEESLALLGQQMLKRLGYEVVAMTSSLEALETFRAQPHSFHLVITDQTMPQMTGIKMAEEMLRIRPELPIILCTGFIETVLREEALARGLRDLITKPLKKAELARIIRKVLDENA